MRAVRNCIRPSVLVTFTAVMGTLSTTAVRADAHIYEVGVAAVDVTPDYPIRLNGFGGRRTESEGVTQRIWAKALAIGKDEEQPVILIALDSLGIRESMVDEVARRLKEKKGIERARIAVAFSHSHTTPKVTNACDTIFSSPIPPEHQAHIEKYTQELTDHLEEVALKALADRQPSTLSWAVGKVAFAINRRPQGGPVDHTLPTLVVKSAKDDALRAVYVTYACHCVTLGNNKISGDWSGYAQEAIQRAHPGVIGLVSIGCGSDANPSSGVTDGNTAVAADQGDQIAREVERLLAGTLKPISGPITATLNHVILPLNSPPSRESLEETAKGEGAEAYNARFHLDKLKRGEPLVAQLEYPIQTWAFGDSLEMVFLAGEVCNDYAVRLRKQLDESRLWMHGYSNDFCAYIPSERLLREGGYGGGGEIVYFALPNTLQAGLEDKIVNEVIRQSPPAFHQPAATDKTADQPPFPADKSLAQMRTHDDLVIELAAAEPLLEDPIAIDFGYDGRLWVAEIPNYTHNIADEQEQGGSVKTLYDEDQDGRYDKAVVFQDKLRFPFDVKAWRQGVIVCDAPDIFYLEDTDGDGQADVRKILLSGFSNHNPQARVNSLRWGVDGWLYGSCGLFGGHIRSFNGQELELGDRDFRFNPDTGAIEAVAGRTQQGLAFDAAGNRFGCDSGTLIEHYPLSENYLARNPYLASPPQAQYIVGDSNELFPIGTPTVLKLSGPPGRPTSACGLEIYRDDLLGKDYEGNSFTAEPVNQLVHRRVLSPKGITFETRRAANEAQREFLASTDSWFRPVQIRTGLDGCLYIVDMYRAVIEHPIWMAPEALQSTDPAAGNKAGRIYRVRPANQQPRPVVDLGKLPEKGLVAALESPNGPQRDYVQQIILQRQLQTAASELEKLVRSSQRPDVRLAALNTLGALDSLSESVVLDALNDHSAAVRVHAIRLSESLFAKSPEVVEAVLALVADESIPVQQQLAYSLGACSDSRAAVALAEIAWNHQNEPFTLAAACSSLNKSNSSSILSAVLKNAATQAPSAALIDALVKYTAKQGTTAQVIQAVTLLGGAKDAPSVPWRVQSLATLWESADADVRTNVTNDAGVKQVLERFAASARKSLELKGHDTDQTAAATHYLAAMQPRDESTAELVISLLEPRNPPAVQQAALDFFSATRSPRFAEELLNQWNSFSPAMRPQVLDGMLAQPELTALLLERVKTGDLRASEIDAAHRQQLLQHGDEKIRTQAKEAFGSEIASDRRRIVESYQAAKDLTGSADRGRLVFEKHCGACHKIADVGHAVGPDLAALTNRTPVALIESIFDPNRNVEERYRSYTIVTDDGLSHAGVLVSESASSITLLEQQAKESVLLRSAIEFLQSTGMSLMPEGLEKDLSPQNVADVIAFVADNSQRPKSLPGNSPATVKAGADGSILLRADQAEVFGNQITYDSANENIGFWFDQSDYVAWTVEADIPQEFDVFVEWASDDRSAANTVRIDGLAESISVGVVSTAGLENFRTKRVGKASLRAGRSRIVISSDGPMQGVPLVALKGIYLVHTMSSLELALDAADGAPRAPDAADECAALLDGLAVGTDAEYERIPELWQHAIAAGKRNDSQELLRLLDLALPKPEEPLRHWQAVVVGGGAINGLSASGVWPRERILSLLDDNEPLTARWTRTISLASRMADDESVRPGTRYDALRILGADVYERFGKQLVRHSSKGANAELQMGAVSALSDIDHPASADALIAGFENFAPENREIALAGLLRTSVRANALLKALESQPSLVELLTPNQIERLLSFDDPAVCQRAEKLLGKNATTLEATK